jgi:hypothetical protein
MTLPQFPCPPAPLSLSQAALLDAVLDPEPLLQLREQALRHVDAGPGAAWQHAVLALDVALAEMAALRARLVLATDASRPRAPTTVPEAAHRVIDLTQPDRASQM